MRYLTFAEALTIAEVVTGMSSNSLARSARVDLLDSALHAPQAGFGDVDFYPRLVDKAAVLVVRIARNHPLPDGNKRLAWAALNMFCELNGQSILASVDDAVETVIRIAAGELDEVGVAAWLEPRLRSVHS